MSALLRAVLVGDAEALAALEPAWWDLWRRCPAAPPFVSPAWALAWWGVFAPGRLRTVAVFAGEHLVALAPLYVEHGSHGRRLLPVGIGLSDRLDLLADPAHQAQAAGLLAATLRDAMADCDTLSLEELGEDAVALGWPAAPGWQDEIAPQSAAPVLALGSADAPLAGVPSGKRRKLRMAENRVARRGGCVAPVEPDEVPGFLDTLSRLHGARWTARGDAGVLADDDVRRFHAAALPGLVRAGLARLYTLTVADRVAGAYYGLQHGETAYAYIGGFDPDFAFESPGTVLLGHAMTQAAREGVRFFDFLRGQEAYKYEWGAVDRWTSRRTLSRPPGG